MLLTVNDIVQHINSIICDVIEGWQLYGIAQIVTRDTTTMPAEGERYIGIDDNYPAQLYHKINGITIAKQAAGYGDAVNLLYTYNLAMIIFLNQTRARVRPEDLVIMLQGTLPQKIKVDGAAYCNFNFVSVNLNDEQVFAQEYKDASAYKLGLNQHLFQINYNLEVLYKAGCFAVCPPKEVCN